MDQATQTALLNEAVAAAQGGDRTKAKDKLTRYLRYDQKNEHAWLWMSSVVESDRERIFCLNNALKLNPNNKTAKRGLALLGALPAELRGDLDIEVIGVDMKPDDSAAAAQRGSRRGGFTFRRNRKLENVVIILLALFIIAFVAVFFLNVGGARRLIGVALGVTPPTPTATPPPPTPTATPTSPLPTETPTVVAIETPIAGINATPIAFVLNLPDYTATPQPFEIPFFLEGDYSLGQRAYEAGDYDAALQSFQEAAKQNKENYAAHYYQGLIYLEKKDYNRAHTAFSAALKISPAYAPALLGRGQATFNLNGNPLKDYQEAKEAAIVADWVEPYIQSALYYAKRRDTDKAISELETARQLNPNHVTVYWMLAEQHLIVGRIKTARAVLQAGLDLDGTALDLYRVQTKLLIAEKDYTSALAKINLYLSYRPTDPEGWALQGEVHMNRDDKANALTAFNRALDLKLADPRVTLIYRGAVQLRLANPDAARADFEQALRLGITTRNRLLIGQAYYAVNDFENAAAEFKRAVDSDITSFETHYWLGAALVGKEDYDAALDSLNNALGKADTDLKRFDCFYQRAKAYAGLDQREDAIRDLRDALVLNVADREEEQAAAVLLLSQLGGPEVNATHTPTAQP